MLNYFTQHILSIAIWMPIIAGIIVLASANEKKPNVTRWIALFAEMCIRDSSCGCRIGHWSSHISGVI